MSLITLLLISLVCAVIFLLMGFLPSRVFKLGSVLLALVALALFLAGMPFLWLYGMIRGFAAGSFSRADKPTAELTGLDRSYARALDFLSNPLEPVTP